jgi:2-amino-4-hydroxy-6-hydroxymethyldihydropteridine diphosphokinase
LNEKGKPEQGPIPCPEPKRRSRQPRDHVVYIGLGSNIEPETNLPQALDLLCEQVALEEISTVWETPPAGLKGSNFLNAVVRAKTQFSRARLKSVVLRPVEIRLGRVRTANKYAPRTIDLDILVYDGKVVDQNVWKQAFVAAPLAELLPDLPHPETGETIRETAERLARGMRLKPRQEVLRR